MNLRHIAVVRCSCCTHAHNCETARALRARGRSQSLPVRILAPGTAVHEQAFCTHGARAGRAHSHYKLTVWLSPCGSAAAIPMLPQTPALSASSSASSRCLEWPTLCRIASTQAPTTSCPRVARGGALSCLRLSCPWLHTLPSAGLQSQQPALWATRRTGRRTLKVRHTTVAGEADSAAAPLAA